MIQKNKVVKYLTNRYNDGLLPYESKALANQIEYLLTYNTSMLLDILQIMEDEKTFTKMKIILDKASKLW